MARIKPGTMGGMSPGWTQTATERFRRGPKKRERRRVNPQEILAWLQLSQAVAQDKGIIGSVASRIQRSMRETELAEKRRQARMDMNAETRKRRNEIAEAVPPDVQAEMALLTPEEAYLREFAPIPSDPPLPAAAPAPAPAPAPAAAPVEAAAVPQAAGVVPGVQMPKELQDWHKPTRMFPPRTDIADAPQFQPPEAPTTRPDWPPKVFTFTELMSQARGARTDEEFDRVAAQLAQVVTDAPAM